MILQTILMRTLYCLFLLSGLLEATSLMRIKKAEGVLRIDSTQANGFLSQSRPKRNIDPKWHRGTPDFQSYYRYYNSIGHIEGLYEIDKLRMLYQQMRHLEHVYGPDASSHQNALGVQTTTLPPTTTTPLPPTTQPPPPPTTQPPSPLFTEADVIYLCNAKDPLCKPQIVYLPMGAVPVLCDPRYHPACKPKTAVAAPPAPPPPPPPEKTVPPPPPEITIKGMEYDCDPYWDPDCLIDHPPRPIEPTAPPPSAPTLPPVKVEEKVEEEPAAVAIPEAEDESKNPEPYFFDPYDFRRDLFDPYRYADPAPVPEPQ